MAHLGPMIRVASSTRIAARLGITVNALKISQNGNSPKSKDTDDLSASFRRLGISPVEAHMSAASSVSITTFIGSLHSTQEYRLPSLAKPVRITVPTLHNGAILEKDLPPILDIVEKTEPLIKREIHEAPSDQVIEKHAARLIVIRRRKMKRHKLRKLRKKMKFAEQMAKVRDFEAFDAANYVTDVLRRTKEKPIPRFWKGKRLPQPIIQQLMEEEEIKKKRRQQK
ncbi:hypothetical protein Hamer_G011298 [Homarus americanus]|uniref:Ribosomal protein mS38 C-terminal domain-containing protein n=1 Tax=Homarus americanus TaxID=6706 RepID=A0A8J5JP94_HOMAM|nr:hypothetical protein Hamer_G011298 [Homarus americanus]